MEEVVNMTRDDVLDVMINFPITPLGRKVIITLNVSEPDGNVVLSESEFSESQFVIAVGSHVKDIKPGSKVLLDLERMMEFAPSTVDAYDKVGRIKIRPLNVNGKMYGMINEGVIDALDLREE